MIKKKKKILLQRMRVKLIWVFLIFMIGFISLMVRIGYINKNDGREYEKIVLAQQRYDSIALPYRRGEILDRNGTPLATSEKVYNLILEPKNICRNEKTKEATVNALLKYFDTTKEEVEERLNDSSSLYQILLKKLEYQQVEPFHEFLKTKEAKDVVGIWFEEEYKRHYPHGKLACHAIGFTVSGNVGQGGIEGYYNEELNGVNGREYGYLTEDLTLERTTKQPIHGYHVVSTIDANIQMITEKKIDGFMKKTGAKGVSVLIMNPSNGEILAMANSNGFDLNDPFADDVINHLFADQSNSGGKNIQEQIEELSDKEKVEYLNQAWRNYIISDGFEPGSTYKSFTIAGVLEESILGGNETYTCLGKHKVEDYVINCNNRDGHGELSVSEALMYSCNVALMQIVEKEGKNTFAKYQKIFGFGTRTNIDLYGEADGLIYQAGQLNPVELATSAFGQGPTVTMMQTGAAFSSLINGGDYYEPHVVKQVIDEKGSMIQNMEGTLLRKTISKEVSDTMRGMLHQVVESGTAQKAKVAGYTIGGKTGTAEKLPRGNGKYVLSFIGFAPVEKPEVVVYVVVDEPAVEDQASSGLGTIIAQSIFKELLPYMNIYQSSLDENSGDSTVGDQEAIPIYDGIAPGDPTTEESTEDGGGDEGPEGSEEPEGNEEPEDNQDNE